MSRLNKTCQAGDVLELRFGPGKDDCVLIEVEKITGTRGQDVDKGQVRFTIDAPLSVKIGPPAAKHGGGGPPKETGGDGG